MDFLYSCLSNYDVKYGYEKEYFWVSGVCLVIIGSLGFVGNVITCITLWSGSLRNNSFYQLLFMLAIFDIFFITRVGIHDGYQALACEPQNENVGHLTYQVLNIGLTGSTYTTIVISLERYLGICHSNTKIKGGVWIYIMPVLVITVSYNFPRFLERKYFIINGTLQSNRSDFSSAESYKYGYYFIASTVINSLIPMLSLAFLNGSIILVVKRVSKNLRKMSDISLENHQKSKTNILFAVVVFSLICNLPRVIYKSLYYFGSDGDEFREKWWFIVPIKKLTMMLNSSINFVIYCLLGKKFRKELCRLTKKLKKPCKHNFT